MNPTKILFIDSFVSRHAEFSVEFGDIHHAYDTAQAIEKIHNLNLDYIFLPGIWEGAYDKEREKLYSVAEEIIKKPPQKLIIFTGYRDNNDVVNFLQKRGIPICHVPWGSKTRKPYAR